MLSIIIPTLNEEKYLPILLKNIKEQNKFDIEVIVSDGNSSDKTKEIALENNCVFIQSNIRKPAHQRNQGVKVAKYETLLFLDADVLLPKNFLNNACQEFVLNKLSIASFYLRFGSTKFSYRIYSAFYSLICYIAQYFRPASIGAAIMIKKELHNKIGGFREDLYVGEDYDYGLRASREGKFRMIKKTFFYFSNRRWEKEGQIKTIKKLTKLLLHYILRGPIKKEIVEYEFGKY